MAVGTTRSFTDSDQLQEAPRWLVGTYLSFLYVALKDHMKRSKTYVAGYLVSPSLMKSVEALHVLTMFFCALFREVAQVSVHRLMSLSSVKYTKERAMSDKTSSQLNRGSTAVAHPLDSPG